MLKAAVVSSDSISLWSDCLELSKARLSALVVVTTFVGFWLASDTSIDLWRLMMTMAGTALAAAGANSFNQWYEVLRDAHMIRTRNRPLPAGRMQPISAFLWAFSTSLAGVLLLAGTVNLLTAALALANILIYVLIYTPLKARSSLCTLVGAVCGAIPPVMGWTGATGSVGAGAWILGAVLFIWQIPHFLSLAWLYREDYERGGFKMLPIVDPTGRMTCAVILLYCIALLPIGISFTLSGYTGVYCLLGSLLLGLGFLALGVRLFFIRTDGNARALFFASLIYLPLVLGLMVADKTASRSFLTYASPAADRIVDGAESGSVRLPVPDARLDY